MLATCMETLQGFQGQRWAEVVSCCVRFGTQDPLGPCKKLWELSSHWGKQNVPSQRSGAPPLCPGTVLQLSQDEAAGCPPTTGAQLAQEVPGSRLWHRPRRWRVSLPGNNHAHTLSLARVTWCLFFMLEEHGWRGGLCYSSIRLPEKCKSRVPQLSMELCFSTWHSSLDSLHFLALRGGRL